MMTDFIGKWYVPAEQVVLWLATFLCALLATRLVLAFAPRLQLLDRPSFRSSHTETTPRGGGLAIVIAFFLALLALYLGRYLKGRLAEALTFGGAIAVVGFLDDRKSLPATARLIVQVVAAVMAVTLIGVRSHLIGGGGALGDCSIRILAVLAIVWATNLFNFMDGIDGIAAVQAIFMAAGAATFNAYLGGDSGLTAAMWTLTAASAGFLVWNWSPARIFMGDVGSGFLGFTLAIFFLSMSRDHAIAVEISLILSGTFVVDATVTLIRRVVRGDRWFDAHRMHAYQHLARHWRSHRAVTLSIAAIDVGWLLPWAWATAIRPADAALFVVLALLPLVILATFVGAGAP